MPYCVLGLPFFVVKLNLLIAWLIFVFSLFWFSLRISVFSFSNSSDTETIGNYNFHGRYFSRHKLRKKILVNRPSLRRRSFFPLDTGQWTSHIIKKRKKKPWIDFLMVIMASGFAGGRVRTMRWRRWRRTESCKMTAMLQLIGWQSMQPWFIAYIFDSEHPFYGQLTPVKSRGDL